MAVELRLSIKIGLEVEVPMEKFLDGSSITDLATLLNEQLTENYSTIATTSGGDDMVEGEL